MPPEAWLRAHLYDAYARRSRPQDAESTPTKKRTFDDFTARPTPPNSGKIHAWTSNARSCDLYFVRLEDNSQVNDVIDAMNKNAMRGKGATTKNPLVLKMLVGSNLNIANVHDAVQHERHHDARTTPVVVDPLLLP